jgi:hypothetical protein
MAAAGILESNPNNREQRPSGFFAKMGDSELVEFARRFMESKGITGRYELNKSDLGIYIALVKRERRSPGIMAKVGFRDMQRDWVSTGDDELVALARNLVETNRIRFREELRKADKSMYETIMRREKEKPGLMERIGLGKNHHPRRNWESMDDNSLVSYTRGFMRENGITLKCQLTKLDSGLVFVLRQRGIIQRVGFGVAPKQPGFFDNMSEEGIVDYAKNYIREKKVTGRFQLCRIHPTLYEAIRRRRLFARVGLRKKHLWASLEKDELVQFAREHIAANGITSRYELEKSHKRLYHALWRKGLLDHVEIETSRPGQQRSWKSISDEGLINHANRFIEENGITTPAGFKKADAGLFWILGKRGLYGSLRFPKSLRVNRDWASLTD